MPRDARLSALHRGGLGLPGPRFRLLGRPPSYNGGQLPCGSVQRAPRTQVVVPGGRLPCLPRRAVTSRRRGTPRLAPPSGSSPETPLDERGWESYSIASICSQDKNAFCRQYATAEKTRLAMRCQHRRDFHELISPLRRQPAFTGERAKLLAGGRGFDRDFI